MAKRYLANYLRAYRKSSGLTQAEVAFVVGINQSDLCHYETGRREPSLRVVIALHVLYRIPIWKLFAGVYQAGVGETKRRMRALQGKLLTPNSSSRSKHQAQKLAWISDRLNLPLPALL
jgi:transcriptional regulator with XRE-family HTH domain